MFILIINVMVIVLFYAKKSLLLCKFVAQDPDPVPKVRIDQKVRKRPDPDSQNWLIQF
jgi:hypothetical protein